jgi:aspartate carbamoyltransferase catalytic subunit
MRGTRRMHERHRGARRRTVAEGTEREHCGDEEQQRCTDDTALLHPEPNEIHTTSLATQPSRERAAL